MPKYSIIIPIWNPCGKMADIIERCIDSVIAHSHDYELIKIENVKGFPKAVNMGLAQAKGEYLIVLNDDTEIQDDEWLEKLAKEGYISSWRFHPFFITGELVPDGSCFCIPRDIFEKLGFLDEQFCDGYGFEDSDYWMRASEAGIPFFDAQVNMKHFENKTFQTYFKELKEGMTTKNKSLFRIKWKL